MDYKGYQIIQQYSIFGSAKRSWYDVERFGETLLMGCETIEKAKEFIDEEIAFEKAHEFIPIGCSGGMFVRCPECD